jgi:hypothetical protein
MIKEKEKLNSMQLLKLEASLFNSIFYEQLAELTNRMVK